MVDEPEDRAARIAWANALEGAARAVFRYLGWPEGSGNDTTKSHTEISWEATAAFTAGLLSLAEQAHRHGLTWPQAAAFARAEQEGVQRHLWDMANPQDAGR